MSALIIGGGFAGIEAAIFLRKRGIETTLISNRDHTWIYPISIWIPTGEIKPDKVKLPLKKLAKRHGFTFRQDTITRIDLDGKRVLLENSELSYEYLIIATGQDKLQPKGVENTLSICGKPEEAIEIQHRLATLLDKKKGNIAFGFGGNPKDNSAVRGGPVFEVLFNVDNWLKKKGLRDQFTLHFFAPMSEPGKRMGERALGMMDSFYKRADIQVHVGSKIMAFKKNEILFENETKITSDLTIFVPAGTGQSYFSQSKLPLNDAGFIRVDPCCRVEGREDVWAIGDAAALEGPKWKAKQGHIAEVMGRIAADDIAKMSGSGGEKRSDKDYRTHLEILCLMDAGKHGALVKRNHKKTQLLQLPIIGHWMKKSWGLYWKWSKMKYIPRIPGM